MNYEEQVLLNRLELALRELTNISEVAKSIGVDMKMICCAEIPKLNIKFGSLNTSKKDADKMVNYAIDRLSKN